MKRARTNDSRAHAFTRRSFLETAIGAYAITPIARLSLQLGGSGSGSLTKEQRDRMTPSQVIEELKKGERYAAMYASKRLRSWAL